MFFFAMLTRYSFQAWLSAASAGTAIVTGASTFFSSSFLPQAASASSDSARNASFRDFAMVLPSFEWMRKESADLPLLLQRSEHRRMHEAGHVAAEARDLAHQRRGDEAVLFGRRQEQRLDLGDQVPVHARELELVFE